MTDKRGSDREADEARWGKHERGCALRFYDYKCSCPIFAGSDREAQETRDTSCADQRCPATPHKVGEACCVWHRPALQSGPERQPPPAERGAVGPFPNIDPWSTATEGDEPVPLAESGAERAYDELWFNPPGDTGRDWFMAGYAAAERDGYLRGYAFAKYEDEGKLAAAEQSRKEEWRQIGFRAGRAEGLAAAEREASEELKIRDSALDNMARKLTAAEREGREAAARIVEREWLDEAERIAAQNSPLWTAEQRAISDQGIVRIKALIAALRSREGEEK